MREYTLAVIGLIILAIIISKTGYRNIRHDVVCSSLIEIAENNTLK